MSVKVGDSAPDFTLKDSHLKDMTLSAYKGKNVVLLFYPLDWSPVCTDEMCEVRDGYLKDFENLDAQVIGISVDSPFSHKAWAEAQKISFPLLSDFNKEACKKYGAYYEDLIGLKGVAKRSAFVIDKNGKIVYAWVSDDAKVKPNLNELKQTLQKMRA